MVSGGRGQAFSMDLVIGVLVFMLAVGIIYSLLSSRGDDNTTPLRIESEVIAERLTSTGVTDQNQLNMAGLAIVAQDAETDYQSLKEQLGVTDEFCIYLTDENGNLVYIQDPSTGDKYPGIGSGTGDITLTQWDIPCGEQCSGGQCS